jgi:pimeloyl-ACP methyl ester carboxylesterase
MPYALNRGVRLYWNEYGSGPPVLLIMGLSFTHEMWYRIVPCLAEQYRVIVFDNRGMGRSDVPKGRYSIRQMATDALAVLDAAGVAKAHIIGASMGGMIAQEIAIRHPKRVLSLVLGSTSYGGFFSRWPSLRRRPRGITWSESDSLARERAMVPLLYADTTAREFIEEDLQIRSCCQWSRTGFLRQFAAILLWNSFRRLPRIKAPTLVIHGDKDVLVPPQNGRVVARRIPAAKFVLIPNAGHVATTDQPALCLELVIEFLKDHVQASVDAAR